MSQVLTASPMSVLSLGRVPPVRPQGPEEPVLPSSVSPVGESSHDAGTGAGGITDPYAVDREYLFGTLSDDAWREYLHAVFGKKICEWYAYDSMPISELGKLKSAVPLPIRIIRFRFD